MLFSNCPEHTFFWRGCHRCEHEEEMRQAKILEDRIERFADMDLDKKLNVVFGMLLKLEKKS